MFRMRWLLVQGIMSMILSSSTSGFVSPSKTLYPSLFAVGSTANTQEFTALSSNTDPTSFVSPVYQCFIEDTDSYGVMFNANYLRSFDRALHSFYAMGQQVTNDQRSILDSHDDWVIVAVNHQKFRSSPKLGGRYCVHGTLVKHEENFEVWDVTMQESNDFPQSNIFNSAQVTIAKPDTFVTPTRILSDPFDSNNNNKATSTTQDVFRLFRDEFDAHCSTHIPLRNVLTLFERARSNYLGGPDRLRKLKEEHGLLFVVTKIDHCCKFPIAIPSEELRPGQLVTVETNFQVKRKGMIIECHHTLVSQQEQAVAQATVSLMTLDSKTFKPSTNLPDWLRDLWGMSAE